MSLSWNFVSNSIAVLALGVSALTYFSTTSDQRDFNGLRLAAELEDGQLHVLLPTSFNSGPTEVLVTGTVFNMGDQTATPIVFKDLPLSFITEEVDGYYRRIVYEDIRPVVCRSINSSYDCEGYEIDAISVVVRFPRGEKPLNVYEENGLGLS